MTRNIYEHCNSQGEHSLEASRGELPTRNRTLVGTLEGITREHFEEVPVGHPSIERVLRVHRTLALQNYEIAHHPEGFTKVEAYITAVSPFQGSGKTLVLATPQERPPFTGERIIKRYWGSKTELFTGTDCAYRFANVSITYAGTLNLSRRMLCDIRNQANMGHPATIYYKQPKRKQPRRITVCDADVMGGI